MATPRRRAPLLAAVAVALTAVLALVTPALAQPVAATQLRVFTPSVAGRLAAGVAVVAHAEASCFARSLASTGRPDAYRCEADDAILDPCFLDPMGGAGLLYCALEPFSLEVVELALVDGLPEPLDVPADPDYTSARAWALVLEGGQRCTLLTGATAGIAGLRIDYGCDDGSAVLGPIDRSLPVWRVFHRADHGAASLDRVVVVQAWF
jgi:hypothetical protein